MTEKKESGCLFIDQTGVGKGHPCYIIAEVAQAHDGSLGAAHAYIEALAKTGVNAVKFQTHIAHAESTEHERFRINFSLQDKTRYDYWKRMEFTEEQWFGLADHAHAKGLAFLSSPFSLQAVELLMRLGVPAWKVGSGEMTNLPMIEHVCATRKPVLFSSGLSLRSEVDAAAGCAARHATPFGIFQCTSIYPCPPEKLGLNVLDEIRAAYRCPVGLSDHSGSIYAGLAAVSLGANLLEVHVVFSRECFGPDTASSVTTAELRQLVEGVRFVEQALRNPVDKQAQAEELHAMRHMFGKGIVAARDIMAGEPLSENDLACKKPARGIPAARLSAVVGRRLKHSCKANEFIQEDNLAP